jgi:hypothetical protein
MAIKDEAAFEELKPYLKMTVAPNGVTVGDLNFVVAQTQWSTALLPIATAQTIPADVNLSLFQTAQGDPGQGFTTGLTVSQTSWQDTQGRLPANQVFIATSCGFQFFVRNSSSASGALATPVTEGLLSTVSATHAIGRKLSWEVTIGDGITRNYGSLLDYSGYGGVYSVVNPSYPARVPAEHFGADQRARRRRFHRGSDRWRRLDGWAAAGQLVPRGQAVPPRLPLHHAGWVS